MVCYFKYILCFCFINAVAFAQQPSFSRYKVDLFRGYRSAIKIKGNALAERYKTIITNTYYSRNGMNGMAQPVRILRATTAWLIGGVDRHANHQP